jgi:hypothetical protein
MYLMNQSKQNGILTVIMKIVDADTKEELVVMHPFNG